MTETASSQAGAWSYQGWRLISRKLPSRLVVMVPVGAEQGEAGQRLRGVLSGGAGIVQLEARALAVGDSVGVVGRLVWQCRQAKALCLIEGQVDVALAALADGVHLEPGDMPVALARRLMGPGATIGVTCHSLADAVLAEREGASYLLMADHLAGDRVALGRVMRRTGLPACVNGHMAPSAPGWARPAGLFWRVGAAVTEAADPEGMTQALVDILAGGPGAVEEPADQHGRLPQPAP